MKKFRQVGIEPSLKLKFDRMFPRDIATGKYAWAPSSGAIGANEVDLGTSNVDLEGDDLEEGSGDLEENVNLNFENHISRGVVGVHMSSSSNTKSSGKRKEREHPMPRARKKKSYEIGAQLVSLQQQLLDIISRSESTSMNRDLPCCSIPEVMTEFQSIPGSIADDEFFDLAVEFLRVRRNREIWASIIGIEKKYNWLQRSIARRKNT